MQEYRRQIAYLYAYEHGVQMRSAGFVKVEEREGQCRLTIHLKSYCYPGEEAGKAYIYFYHQDRIVGIFLGELQNLAGVLKWEGTISANNVQNKGIRFVQTRGVWIRRPGGRNFVAEWDDGPVDVSRFVLYPRGGQKCIRCPWFGSCERSGENGADRRQTVYEGSYSSGAQGLEDSGSAHRVRDSEGWKDHRQGL